MKSCPKLLFNQLNFYILICSLSVRPFPTCRLKTATTVRNAIRTQYPSHSSQSTSLMQNIPHTFLRYIVLCIICLHRFVSTSSHTHTHMSAKCYHMLWMKLNIGVRDSGATTLRRLLERKCAVETEVSVCVCPSSNQLRMYARVRQTKFTCQFLYWSARKNTRTRHTGILISMLELSRISRSAQRMCTSIHTYMLRNTCWFAEYDDWFFLTTHKCQQLLFEL